MLVFNQSKKDFDTSSSKKSTNTSFANQGSMPTTPNLFNSSSASVFQYPTQQKLEIKKKDSLNDQQQQLNNSSIKNLTLQFMVNDTETIGDWMTTEKFAKFITSPKQPLSSKPFSRKRRSYSESSLFSSDLSARFVEPKPHFHTKGGDDHDDDYEDPEGFSYKLTKSEMRDKNIRDPMTPDIYNYTKQSVETDVLSAMVAHPDIKRTAHHLELLTAQSPYALVNENSMYLVFYFDYNQRYFISKEILIKIKTLLSIYL